MALKVMKDFIFAERFWLPSNVSWSDFEDDKIHIPKVQELWALFPTAILLLVLRILWERYVALPIGRIYGVSERRPRQPEPNALLENAFKKYHRIIPNKDVLEVLSKQTDKSMRQLERWWRLRRVCNKPSEMQRLGESSYKAVVYTVMFVSGVYVVWGKSYVWDTRLCWVNYPKHDITAEYFWYYCLLGGHYLSLLGSAMYDNRRKDFLEMMVHHVASLGLIINAWMINFVRVSVLVGVIHDVVDPLLDGAKVAKYLKFKRLPDVLFAIFTVVWIVSRLIILPLWVGWTSFFEGHVIIGLFPAYCLMAGLYLILQILHIYWSYFILRVIYHYVILKELIDSRSDTEPDSENDDQMACGENSDKYLNGHSYHSNGHPNGHLNGHPNGHPNGHLNHSNGALKHLNGAIKRK